jgi:hypothetical protein
MMDTVPSQHAKNKCVRVVFIKSIFMKGHSLWYDLQNFITQLMLPIHYDRVLLVDLYATADAAAAAVDDDVKPVAYECIYSAGSSVQTNPIRRRTYNDDMLLIGHGYNDEYVEVDIKVTEE